MKTQPVSNVILRMDVDRQVQMERDRQDEKWGEQNHSPEKWLTILAEEVGEAAKALLEGDEFQYRQEMIQVAAVACAAVEASRRLAQRITS